MHHEEYHDDRIHLHLAAVVAVLLTALVLCWMRSPRKASKASPASTISVEVNLTGNDEVSRQLDGLTAKAAHLADMLARAKRDAGLIALPVRDEPPKRTGQTPPKRLPPSPAPAKKQRTR